MRVTKIVDLINTFSVACPSENLATKTLNLGPNSIYLLDHLYAFELHQGQISYEYCVSLVSSLGADDPTFTFLILNPV